MLEEGEGEAETQQIPLLLKDWAKLVSNTLFPHHLTFLRKEAFFLQLDL